MQDRLFQICCFCLKITTKTKNKTTEVDSQRAECLHNGIAILDGCGEVTEINALVVQLMGAARGDRCDKADTENGLPVVQTEQDLLEEHLTLLIVKDRQSGATLTCDCETKGPGDAWVVKQLVNDLTDWNGRTDVCLMSDGEPAITALQRAVAKARPDRQTLLKNSPPYNPQSNGGAEKVA